MEWGARRTNVPKTILQVTLRTRTRRYPVHEKKDRRKLWKRNENKKTSNFYYTDVKKKPQIRRTTRESEDLDTKPQE